MTRARNILLLALVTLAALAIATQVHAGAHNRQVNPEDILVDPTKRIDITGTVLITGANRGIGLAMARNYAKRGWRVVATARKPEKANDLNKLAASNDNVSVERLDVLDQEQVDALAEKYADQPIDVLLNNAAILGDKPGQVFGDFDFDLFNRVINTNVAGPLRMAGAFADHVAASEQKKIIAISSVQGSITLIRSATIQFYSASKTALNMSMRAVSAAVEDRGITVALISPGAVDTDMMAKALEGSNFRMRLLTPEQSAEAVINVIDQYGFDMSGTFLSHEGVKLPW
ncbi:MAG: SDR family oxidoreductase [Gammaproteobacteria bacterium]|nr:SDR family oxidoreductase [Gammaproteobacteria bacterium]